jgi:Domain of unknown function (DUF4159)
VVTHYDLDPTRKQPGPMLKLNRAAQYWTRRKSMRGLLFGLAVLAAMMILGWVTFAQPYLQREVESAREMDSYRGGQAYNWTNDERFKKDVFTFVRLKYHVDGEHGYGRDPEYRWQIDAPDSELNFSYRLQQVTSLKVDPNPKWLAITNTELFNYPFVYIVEPGRLTFREEELPILKRYLLNGGFLMCDDFWGDKDWENFSSELKRLFPDRPPQDLPLTHPIFNCVFPLKEKPQVPGVPWGIRHEFTGISYEQAHNPGAEEPHYRAILDDKGRIMVMLCHNTDMGDGWEREGESEYYFHEFSEKFAYPLGINIVFYAMTH